MPFPHTPTFSDDAVAWDPDRGVLIVKALKQAPAAAGSATKDSPRAVAPMRPAPEPDQLGHWIVTGFRPRRRGLFARLFG